MSDQYFAEYIEEKHRLKNTNNIPTIKSNVNSLLIIYQAPY